MANTPNLDLENVNVLLDTDYAYNQLVSEIIAKINNNNLKIDELPNDFILSTEKGAINGVASLGNDGIIPKSQLPIDSGSVERVADITARDTIINLYDNKLVFVIDASDDITVTSGWAMYIYSSASLSWTKIIDGESLDINLTWDDISNKPTVFPPDYHVHSQININAQNISDLQNNKVDILEGSRLVSETEIEVFNDKYSKTEVDDKLVLATETNNGLMPKEYITKVDTNTTNITELENLDVIIRNNDLDDVIADVIPLDADLFNGQNANYYAKQSEVSSINTKVGSETLFTTAQTLGGAINEHEGQINTSVPKADIIQTTAVNDSTKIPSSAVTYGINAKTIPFFPYNGAMGSCNVTISKISDLIILTASSNIEVANNDVACILPLGHKPQYQIMVYTIAKQTSGIGKIAVTISPNGEILLSAQEYNEPMSGWNICVAYPVA